MSTFTSEPLLLGLLLGLAVGLGLGGTVGGLIARSRSQERVAGLREELAIARVASGAGDSVLDAFRSASGQTMAEQSKHLLQLAESRYQALEQSSELRWKAQGDAVVARLEEYAARLASLEQQRQQESAVLSHAVGDLRRAQEELRDETRGLSGALRDRTVRGTWGEVQLRRVLELSGMIAHTDFVEQVTHGGDDRSGRPDVIVRLPNGRSVVIDSKAPLDAYLRAGATEDDGERQSAMDAHARAVGSHVTQLAKRRYDRAVPGSVDFVVMFVPGDAFLSAAMQASPELFEFAAERDVLIATPSTLLAFLRGVASGWREQTVADEAAAVAALGRELHERIVRFAAHFASMGQALGRAVGSYNDALGSMERRLLVTARRLEDHGSASREKLPNLAPLDEVPRQPQAPELCRSEVARSTGSTGSVGELAL